MRNNRKKDLFRLADEWPYRPILPVSPVPACRFPSARWSKHFCVTSTQTVMGKCLEPFTHSQSRSVAFSGGVAIRLADQQTCHPCLMCLTGRVCVQTARWVFPRRSLGWSGMLSTGWGLIASAPLLPPPDVRNTHRHPFSSESRVQSAGCRSLTMSAPI